jgi:SAM-dependent methyltransferase
LGAYYDTAFFERRWEEKWDEGRSNRCDTWNDRAKEWDDKLRREGVRKQQGEARVQDTAEYLRSRGLLGPDCDAADVGCGPGRFVAEFARTSRSALGVDISPKMAEYGAKYAQELGLRNATFKALDFQEADIRDFGWEGGFDLAFSSITPAVRGLRGLKNLIAMSRCWCFNACFVRYENALNDRIMRELFGREAARDRTSHSQWFFELFNLLWLWG